MCAVLGNPLAFSLGNALASRKVARSSRLFPAAAYAFARVVERMNIYQKDARIRRSLARFEQKFDGCGASRYLHSILRINLVGYLS